jgi:hypothetical protein
MPAVLRSGGCGILSWFVPPALAGEVAREAAAERDAALAAAGQKVPRRRARLLPPQLAVYFTLALCLLARLPYQDVLRSLAGDRATGLAVPAGRPSAGSFSPWRARARGVPAGLRTGYPLAVTRRAAGWTGCPCAASGAG